MFPYFKKDGYKEKEPPTPMMFILMVNVVSDMVVDGFKYPPSTNVTKQMYCCIGKDTEKFKSKWADNPTNHRHILELYNGSSVGLNLSTITDPVITPIFSTKELQDFMNSTSYKSSGINIQGIPENLLQ